MRYPLSFAFGLLACTLAQAASPSHVEVTGLVGLGEFTNKQGLYSGGRLAGASVARHLRPSVTAELWYSRVTLHGKSGRVGAGHVLVPGLAKSFLLDRQTQPYVAGGFGFWRRDGTTATPVVSASAGLKRFYGEYFYVRPELRLLMSDLGGRATGTSWAVTIGVGWQF